MGGTGDEAGFKITASGDADATLQQLVNAMKADHLDEDGNLSVELSNGILSINGKKQPEDVLKKYEGLFNGKKELNFSIKVEDK